MSLLTAREVADWFGIDVQTVYRKVKTNELPCVRIGKNKWSGIRFDKLTLEQWLKGNAKKEDVPLT